MAKRKEKTADADGNAPLEAGVAETAGTADMRVAEFGTVVRGDGNGGEPRIIEYPDGIVRYDY